jgi:hypothetical protein
VVDRLVWTLLAVALAFAPCATRAEGCGSPAVVRFAPGAGAGDVNGHVPRGERDCYVMKAAKGQTLSVTQPDPVDDNIVFQIYQAPWTIRHTEAGWGVGGNPLPGTEETRDARAWSGTLPAAGQYLLVVGTSRGGGLYHLRIEIQ